MATPRSREPPVTGPKRYVTRVRGARESVPVDIESLGDGKYVLTLGGRRHTVDALVLEHEAVSLIVDGRSYDVELDESGDEVQVLVDAELLTVDETFWQRVMSGQLGDFHNEFLVVSGKFEADWPMWEMHPNGDEVVCLLSGSATFLLEETAGTREIELSKSGTYVLVPKGTWHTARAQGPCRMLFITAGEGTQHRPAR